jgi:glucan phosphoethanolaminetransferase (alkaline phosphatase superfamily)
MIRKIRKKHKIIWLILAVLLPLLFIASIVFRHSEPINETIPIVNSANKR